jgi:hypothetical protein
MQLLLKNKLADRSLLITGVAHRAAIIPTASRRLIRPANTFANGIPVTMSFAEQQ